MMVDNEGDGGGRWHGPGLGSNNKYKVTSKLINDLMGKDADLRLKFISENAGKILNLDI